MEFEDKLTITTPEGVTLELVLAGLGSRAIAALLDGLIKAVVTIAVIVALYGGTGLLDDDVSAGRAASEGFFLGLAIGFVVIFVVNFFYDVLFETLSSGRTPGKRWTGLRVVRLGGGPVGFMASAVRNLVRIVDSLPAAYAIGMIAVVFSSKNQRLGDMAAGTIVVRDEKAVSSATPWTPPTSAPMALDVGGITGEELATIRTFLERRATIAPEARDRIARDLAARLKSRLSGMPDYDQPEAFLEQIAAAKAARG